MSGFLVAGNARKGGALGMVFCGCPDVVAQMLLLRCDSSDVVGDAVRLVFSLCGYRFLGILVQAVY